MIKTCVDSDLLVFSHLRWNFVFQRPQHLMTRYAIHRRVFFFEEPLAGEKELPFLHIKEERNNLFVVTPELPEHLLKSSPAALLRRLLDEFLRNENIEHYSCWYYTPMAMEFSDHLRPQTIIYDCMDELSKFHGAPEELVYREQELLELADVVFTGGQSLYEEKRNRHGEVHAFPSGIETRHFNKARLSKVEPEDQRHIPHPRLGFVGVIDERMNMGLLREMAEQKPSWQFVMVGPTAKIDPESLPRAKNIHYLGMKSYEDLPSYLSSWEVALMPFAKNEATRFISPTKTPEYLAAGLQVISTSITDVVNPYGKRGLVAIADTASDFIREAEKILASPRDLDNLRKVDDFLQHISWDETWQKMAHLELEILAKKTKIPEFNFKYGREYSEVRVRGNRS